VARWYAQGKGRYHYTRRGAAQRIHFRVKPSLNEYSTNLEGEENQADS